MKRYRTGETEQEYLALHKAVWEGYLEAQVTRDFLVALTKRRRRGDRCLRFFILVAGSGAAVSAFSNSKTWLILLAVLTAVLSAASSILEWGLEKQKFQAASEQQTEYVDSYLELWETVQNYQYNDFALLQNRYQELEQRGRRIYNRVQEYEPKEEKRAQLYDAVYRRMGVSLP